MNNQNSINLFKQILNNPKTITYLPKEYQTDVDFLELFLYHFKWWIKPYVSSEIFNTLKHREVVFKNKHTKKPKYKPNISLEDEITLLHNILTDISSINLLPTTEKYNNEFLEFLYIIWGDEIENYIPDEMFEQLKNEKLMKEYHQTHENEQKNGLKKKTKKY